MEDRFQTTRWSLILAARGADSQSRRALASLCRTYRAPVLAFIRCSGCRPDEAEDLTQSFFAQLLLRNLHARVEPERGRFRTYLLASLKHFLINVHKHDSAQKRGAQVQLQVLDMCASRSSNLDQMRSPDTPERAFDRAWAQAVLRTALRKLRREAGEAGKGDLFAKAWEFVIERPAEAEYDRIARELGMRRNTLAVAVHRLRIRLRELVCAELAETATNEATLHEEIDDLRECLNGMT